MPPQKGYRPSLLRGCVQLAIALALAGWLLFWFFEALSPRMDSIAELETRHKVSAARPHETCLVTGTLICFNGLTP